MIEPSGVGKLSDIIKACSDPRIQKIAEIITGITVVDVKRCTMYLENFGEFFEDQIKNANVILFSRTENFPEKVRDAAKLIESLNGSAAILTKPWSEMTVAEILQPASGSHVHVEHYCSGHHDHDHCHEHDHGLIDGSCGCDHSAEDIFDTVTIKIGQLFSAEELNARVKSMEQNAGGTILRAKGIVRSAKGYINLQYLPGDISITECSAVGDRICIIGRDLDKPELNRIFNGE